VATFLLQRGRVLMRCSCQLNRSRQQRLRTDLHSASGRLHLCSQPCNRDGRCLDATLPADTEGSREDISKFGRRKNAWRGLAAVMLR
jgi:hypothetical protein